MTGQVEGLNLHFDVTRGEEQEMEKYLGDVRGMFKMVRLRSNRIQEGKVNNIGVDDVKLLTVTPLNIQISGQHKRIQAYLALEVEPSFLGKGKLVEVWSRVETVT